MKSTGIVVLGDLDKTQRHCKSMREQNYVISRNGASMSIPSTYPRHPFKVLIYETINEDSKRDDCGAGQGWQKSNA